MVRSPVLHLIYFYAFFPLLALASAAAFKWGGQAARHVATICLVGTLASRAAAYGKAYLFRQVEVAALLIDTAVLVAFVVVAVRHNRWWLRWIAALQVVATLGHFAKATHSTLRAGGYAIMVSASAYPIVLLLLIAALRERRLRSAASI